MSMLAVIVVRNGRLCAGGQEAFAEAGNQAMVVGEQAGHAAGELCGEGTVTVVDVSVDNLRALSTLITGLIPHDVRALILPASPDGRDFAPHLAATLEWPLLAGAVRVRADTVVLVRTGGRLGEEIGVDRPFVATLVPGVRGFEPSSAVPHVHQVKCGPLDPDVAVTSTVTSVEVLPPEPSTMDLTEAKLIVAGGQGLGSKECFDLLGRVGTAIGASLGGTRVASDVGWIPLERQIGTTGVAVNPRVYMAFAISGATQHTCGLGHPDHIISVNTDAGCPMMAMADLAIVSDATAVLHALATRLLTSEPHTAAR